MLRVVGGIYKSRRIKEVKSDQTRPTTDRNKEALFNILGQYFDGETFLDLFSGSGALGIEALSRGAGEVWFVDHQGLAVKTIKENLKIIGIHEGAHVHKQDVIKFLNNTKHTFDFIIADPPYILDNYTQILNIISTGHLLNNDGIIIFEADRNTALPETSGHIKKFREKSFGNTKFGFYRMEEVLWE